MKTFFDPIAHQYYLNDRPVPSNTQIIRAILGDAIWNATDPWYLDRGTSVHACAAFVAQGKNFTVPECAIGQVAACRKFFEEISPRVLYVEQQYYSESYQFAGTVDLIAVLKNKITIIDWKSSLSPVSEIQVGGYGVLYPQATHGLIVALQEDGNYKCGEMFKLDRRKQEFLACRSVYGIKQRLGLIKSREETTDGK